jgi:hypothetical protein
MTSTFGQSQSIIRVTSTLAAPFQPLMLKSPNWWMSPFQPHAKIAELVDVTFSASELVDVTNAIALRT